MPFNKSMKNASILFRKEQHVCYLCVFVYVLEYVHLERREADRKTALKLIIRRWVLGVESW
jgi:hypothetical protein